MAFYPVLKLSELKDGELKQAETKGEMIALCSLDGQVFAISNICPHAGCLLSENYRVEGGEVECTCHGSRFNIKTGQVTVGPAYENLAVYPVKVEEGEILVDIGK